jgi:ATP-binding cassette subfamily F protein uup
VLLSVENLSKDFRFKPLFENASFNVGWTDRVGLIGVNGSGKTTLLRIIAGEEPQDAGKVILADGKIVGYLPQNPHFDPNESVLDALFSRSGDVMQLIRDYEAVCEQAAHDSNPKLITRMSELSQKIDAAGAWELETKAKVILSKLGITELEAKVGELSGGQRKRIALAHALIFNTYLLILDVRTNHLDSETIELLEEFLSRYAGGLLLVTHDRYFLDRVTNRILEIDHNDIRAYDGNYVYYLETKAAEEERLATEEHKRKQLVKQELAWLRRGAKARTTKQKARIERADELINAPKVQQKQEMDISVAGRRLGTKTIEFEDVAKAYDGKQLVKDFTYVVTRGESIGIIGPNGAGKTTLLDLITGRVQPDSGSVEVGPTVVIGYYDQESRTLNDDQRVIDYVREAGDHVMTSDGSTITAGQMLERFLFPPVMQFANIGKLSGGERRRLYLLRILMGAPNVLLLDEPTNDLDIPTLVALEEYLDHFNGVVIAVSHDRYFLDRVADHVFRFEGNGRIREYPGNYSAFLEIREKEEKERATQEASKKKPVVKEPEKPVTPAARKLSFKEKKELETLEAAIAKAEARKEEIGNILSTETSDYAKIQQLSEEMQAIDQKLEADMIRWAELAELL